MRAIAVIAIAAVLVLCMASTSEAARFEKKMAHLTEEFVAKVNELAKGKWVASLINGRHVTGASRDDIRSLMGVLSHDTSSLDKRQFTAEELRDEIPENFDSSENWPNCPTIARISDQSECGSCWAMAATGAFSDRLCTAGGMQDTQISAGNLLSCCSYCGFGCDGGYPANAWRYFQLNGVLSEYCQPYPFPHCSHHTDSDVYPPCNGSQPTPTCNSTCSDKDIPTRRYYGASAYSVSGVEAFQRELMAHGPFEVSFDVYEDFLSYKSGVYQHVSGDELGGHAVRIVGWGVDNGTPYWKIANSWNEGWGEDGYFRIIRGQDECGIESSGTAGLPAHPTVC